MAMDNTIYKSTSEHFIIKMLFKQGSKNENIVLLQFCTNVLFMMNRKQGVPDPDSTGLNHIIVKALVTGWYLIL
jgi:hypothetical protein